MKTVLLLLLGGFLCGLHGAEGQDTPNPLSMITKLQTEVQALKTEVQALKTQDQSHQSEVQSLKTEVQALKTQDQSHQTEVQSLKTEVQSLKNQIQSLENSQAQLQTSPRVAFFAGFYTDTERGNYGPFNESPTIKYKNVVTNVGGGYSADTGVFTAPLKGLYVFTFVMYAYPNTMMWLQRNFETLAYAHERSSPGPVKQDSSTAITMVTLEAGDLVYVRMLNGGSFYDSHGLLNSFSGFLLFAM